MTFRAFVTIGLKAAAAGVIAMSPGMAADLAVAGLWVTDEGKGRVEIRDCGDGTPCGALVWIAPDEPGSGLDENNPDPLLRSQPLLGLQILWGFEAQKDRWRKGRIYDPEVGKTYRSAMVLNEAGDLEVKGCIGPICRAVVWTRDLGAAAGADAQ